MTSKLFNIEQWRLIVVSIYSPVLSLYLLFAKPGNVLMSSIFGVTGIVVGWFERVFYDTKVKRWTGHQ